MLLLRIISSHTAAATTCSVDAAMVVHLVVAVLDSAPTFRPPRLLHTLRLRPLLPPDECPLSLAERRRAVDAPVVDTAHANGCPVVRGQHAVQRVADGVAAQVGAEVGQAEEGGAGAARGRGRGRCGG